MIMCTINWLTLAHKCISRLAEVWHACWTSSSFPRFVCFVAFRPLRKNTVGDEGKQIEVLHLGLWRGGMIERQFSSSHNKNIRCFSWLWWPTAGNNLSFDALCACLSTWQRVLGLPTVASCFPHIRNGVIAIKTTFLSFFPFVHSIISLFQFCYCKFPRRVCLTVFFPLGFILLCCKHCRMSIHHTANTHQLSFSLDSKSVVPYECISHGERIVWVGQTRLQMRARTQEFYKGSQSVRFQIIEDLV